MLPLAGKKFDCIWSSLQALSTVLVSVVVLVLGRWSLPVRDALRWRRHERRTSDAVSPS